MKQSWLLLSLAMLVIVGVATSTLSGIGLNSKADDEKELKPISEIMENAMKGGLVKKVASGQADEKEKLELLDMMIDLVQNDPPKGDAMQWKMMAGTAMMDAAKVVVGRENAGEELAKSTNCKACHDLFKP